MQFEVKIRKLEKNDYNDFLMILTNLTKVGDINQNDFENRLELINKKEDYIILVATMDNKIVGAGTLFLEYKFIHSLAIKAHIEDIVVGKEYQGHGIGKKIVTQLVEHAKEKGCYKTALCTSKDKIPFYEKCGFVEKETEMVIYHDK